MKDKKLKEKGNSRIKKIFRIGSKLKNLIVDPKYRVYYFLILILFTYILLWRAGIVRAEDLNDPDFYEKQGRFSRHKETFFRYPDAAKNYINSTWKKPPFPNSYPEPGYGLNSILIGLGFAAIALLYEYLTEDK